MPKLDIERLRVVSGSLSRFLDFEQEIEQSIRNEDAQRREEYEEKKRAREKRARKKRLKRLRQMQQQ